MPAAERSVTINRPAADVFAYIADGTKASAWRSSVVEIKHESGDGVGAIYRQRVRGRLRRKVAADYEVTTFDPGRRLAFKGIAGPVRRTGTYRLSESNGRTKLTFKLDAQLGRLRRLLMGRSVQKSMESEMKALDKLKELLEADAPTATSVDSKPGARATPSRSTSARSTATKPAAAKGTAAEGTAAKGAAANTAAPKSTASKSTASKASAAKAPAPTPPRTARRRSKPT